MKRSIILSLAMMMVSFFPVPSRSETQSWTLLPGKMNQARAAFKRAVLLDGRVLVVGGMGPGGVLLTTEIYDPATDTWTLTGPIGWDISRAAPPVVLSDGRVLVCGDWDRPWSSTAAVKIYDPAQGVWEAAAPMNVPRTSPGLTRLADGRVLAAGGHWDTPNDWGSLQSRVFLKSAEIYDPTSNTWTLIEAPLAAERRYGAAFQLPSGKVILQGGITNDYAVREVEIFDPESESWSTAATLDLPMDRPGNLGGRFPLPDGTSLSLGTWSEFAPPRPLSFNLAFISNSTGESWTPAPVPNQIRWAAVGGRLPDGRHILAGGGTQSNLGGATLSSSEIFDYITRTWEYGPSLNQARGWASGARLPDGRVLAFGGYGGADVGYLDTVEVLGGRPAITVGIDIKPGSYPNSINLGSKGLVPVAILSSPDFDARTVDPASITLAGAHVGLKGKGTYMAAVEDVNGDGLPDLVVHVETSALQVTDADTKAVLEGLTFDGKKIKGEDSVRVVP